MKEHNPIISAARDVFHNDPRVLFLSLRATATLKREECLFPLKIASSSSTSTICLETIRLQRLDIHKGSEGSEERTVPGMLSLRHPTNSAVKGLCHFPCVMLTLIRLA